MIYGGDAVRIFYLTRAGTATAVLTGEKVDAHGPMEG